MLETERLSGRWVLVPGGLLEDLPRAPSPAPSPGQTQEWAFRVCPWQGPDAKATSRVKVKKSLQTVSSAGPFLPPTPLPGSQLRPPWAAELPTHPCCGFCIEWSDGPLAWSVDGRYLVESC